MKTATGRRRSPAQAELDLQDTELTSPSAGVILTRAVETGSMLSSGGTVFTLSLPHPVWVRAVSYLIPARYFVSTLQTLFLAGNITSVLFINLLFLIASAVVFIGLTAWKTQRRLD
nr:MULTISPECIES: ABC transporter permease [Brenneria]